MTKPKNRGWDEDFAVFFESPSRGKLRKLLKNHNGERNEYDFKGNWPAFPKVARHVLGFANSGGGCLIIGVAEQEDKTFVPTGIEKLQDKTDVHNRIKNFLPDQLEYDIIDFSYEESEYPKLIGKKFQVLLVEDMPEYIPFVSEKDGDGIRENAIYSRQGTSTKEASYAELQKMFNYRLDTHYSSKGEFELKEHLSELNTLYRNIPRLYDPLKEAVFRTGFRNPQYPTESFEEFVKKMIDEKKEIIQRIISK